MGAQSRNERLGCVEDGDGRERRETSSGNEAMGENEGDKGRHHDDDGPSMD